MPSESSMLSSVRNGGIIRAKDPFYLGPTPVTYDVNVTIRNDRVARQVLAWPVRTAALHRTL